MLEIKYTGNKQFLSDLIRMTRDDEYIFRGVSNDVHLLPGVSRDYNGVKDKEFILLQEFRKMSSGLISGNLDYLDIVACAQHYGLPTRFLDWTRNPFVALYFSISDIRYKDYKLYYTKLSDNIVMNHSITINNTWNPVKRSFIQEYKDFINIISDEKGRQDIINALEEENTEFKKYSVNNNYLNENGLIIYDANYSNSRLIAQSGLFSIPISIQENNSIEEIKSKTKHINLNIGEKERKELLEYLDNMGYNKAKLFPDLENLCRFIHETHKEIVDTNVK